MKLFRPFDKRLAAELRTQKRPIVKGLLCVVVTSLLTAATIPIIQQAVQAVSDAGQLAEQRLLTQAEIGEIAKDLGKPVITVTQAVDKIEESRTGGSAILSEGERSTLASELQVSEDAIDAALKDAETERSREVSSPMAAVNRLGMLSLLIIAVYAAKYWFTRGQTYYLSYASSRLANQLRLRMFAKLQRLPISYFNEKRAGAIQSVLTNDVNVYQNAVMVIRDSIDGPIKAVTAFVTIVILQWQLAAVAVLFFPVMAWAIQRNSRKMKAAQAQVQEDLSELSAMTQEALQGTRVVKAFSAETQIQQSYGKLVEASFKSTMKAVHRVASLRPLVEFIGAVALATVLYICGWLAFRGDLQVADIAALIFAMDVINQGVRAMGYVNNTYAQVQAASERIYGQVLDIEDEHIESAQAKELPAPKGQIEFRDVRFTYPDGTEALDGIDFTIEPGTSLALVGPSGSGKSTIADLVLRFYDSTSGQILFDGEDVKELKPSWLRSQIGVVPQHTFLFAGTIAENIRLGKPGATDEEVIEAAKAAHADVFIERLPNGYQTTIGEHGVGLSGGEKQRVAIARALVRKPTLLLLDEATSALDAVSEKAVQEALYEIMSERTTLFIAHRLTTAARADRILVLRRGQIIESGSHKELMERNGAYASMYRAFGSGVLGDEI